MWLFTKFGFYSIVCAKQSKGSSVLDQERLMVRARQASQLETLKQKFPVLKPCEISMTDDSDYPCRLFVDRAVFNSVAAELVSGIDYGNFKNEAARQPRSHAYVHALHDVWSVMRTFQDAQPYPRR